MRQRNDKKGDCVGPKEFHLDDHLLHLLLLLLLLDSAFPFPHKFTTNEARFKDLKNSQKKFKCQKKKSPWRQKIPWVVVVVVVVGQLSFGLLKD
jgi:hypothetical protein